MATNTTATATNHTGNGSTTNFAISFTFLANAEIDVTVAGVLKTLDTHYTISGSTITFTSGNTPANGAAVKFQRDTNISTKKVDFTDGSVLTETDLDTNSDQVLFAQQEITDKLSGIEEGATADQTNAEIRTAVEAATDSNVFTDADHSKLNNIEANATQDQTISEIKSLIAGSPLDASHLAANSVDSSELVDGSVDTSHLSADCVTNAKIADDSIDSEHYVDGSIDTAHIGNSQVTTAKIADDSVTNAKIGAGAVGTTELDTGAITTAKLANDAVTNAKMGAGAVGTTELDTGAVTTAKLAADSVTNAKIGAGAVGTTELDTNAVTTAKIADAELTTLAGMQSGTASKLADSTALTADIADLNQIDGMAKQTTITDDDTKFPTSGAVVDFVAAQIAPIGGLEVIANEDSFPTSQPSSGVVISISDIEGLITNGSGVATNARTTGNGSDNVTINGFPSSLQNKTMAAGLGLMVSSTGSSQTYTYHKLLAKEADVEQLSNDINDFAARYRVGSSNPTSDLDAGDLFFNTSTQKLLVYNSTNSAWEEAQSIGNFFISTFSESFDGSRTDFTVSNAPANAQQIILSINGVVQKPNSGTSTPSEGFALSGSTVKLSSAPASGSDVFIVVMGSTVNIGTPSNNTVTSAILQNGSVIEAKLADSAITNAKVNASAAIAGTKISPDFGSQNIVTTGTLSSGDITISNADPRLTFTDSNENPDYYLQADSGQFKIVDSTNSASRLVIQTDGTIDISGNLDANGGLDVTGAITGNGDLTIDSGTFHVDSSNNRVGIGESSPDALLHLKSATTGGAAIQIEQDDGTSYKGFMLLRGNDMEVRGSSGNIEFFTGNNDGAASTERMRIDPSGNVGLGVTNPDTRLHVENSNDHASTDYLNGDAQLLISNTSSHANARSVIKLESHAALVYGAGSSTFLIKDRQNERMRIDSSGDILIGKTSNDFDTAGSHITASGQVFNLVKSGTGVQIKLNRSTNVGTFIEFRRGSSNIVGSISSNNTTTSFNTSSDYRLKENVTAISDGITRLKTLKPSRFNFKAEKDTTVDGFLAHEVTAVSEAVSGTKDEVVTQAMIDAGDYKEETLNDPIYQGIDQSKLVPLLTAALQEAIAKIEVLETKVAALGG